MNQTNEREQFVSKERRCGSWLIDTGRDFWGFFEGGKGACCLRLMGTVGVGGGGGRRGRGLSIGS